MLIPEDEERKELQRVFKREIVGGRFRREGDGKKRGGGRETSLRTRRRIWPTARCLPLT